MAYLIALSGGADSVALLLKMLESGRVAAAAHCHFGLRGAESDRDEAFVRLLCDQRGVRLHVRHFDTIAEARRSGESIETTARRLRYEWFDTLCRTEGYGAVAVAHHVEDQAETILLNLVRGTGLRGLIGMTHPRSGVVRPLLAMTKAEILDYLDREGQSYVTDSTNTDTRYRRNYVRHEVLPRLEKLNPRVCRTLYDTSLRLSEVETIYRIGLDALRARLVTALPDGLCLDADGVNQSSACLTLLHEWLAPYGFGPAQIADMPTLRTGGLIESEAPAPVDGATYLFTRTTDRYEVRRRPHPLSTDVPVPAVDGLFLTTSRYRLGVKYLSRADLSVIPRENTCCVLDADRTQGGLFVRSVRPGDRFAPFGMSGTRLVSDYLTDRHRSRIDKMGALCVCDAGGIVWLINERPVRHTAVTDGTQRLILLYTLPL